MYVRTDACSGMGVIFTREVAVQVPVETSLSMGSGALPFAMTPGLIENKLDTYPLIEPRSRSLETAAASIPSHSTSTASVSPPTSGSSLIIGSGLP